MLGKIGGRIFRRETYLPCRPNHLDTLELVPIAASGSASGAHGVFEQAVKGLAAGALHFAAGNNAPSASIHKK
jgi:hypothetical protein